MQDYTKDEVDSRKLRFGFFKVARSKIVDQREGITPYSKALGVHARTLIPIIFITSFVVQKTKNTWSDVIIHALINGSGFLLVAFGVVG